MYHLGVLEVPGRERRMTGRNKLIVIAAAIFLLTVGTTCASADTIFDLGTGNTAISGFPGPYAEVDVALVDATHATITFTSLTSGGNIYLMGDGGTVAVNVNATTWTLSGITGSNSGTGFTPGPYSDGGAGNLDGFGVFNQTINSFDGYTHSSDTVSFSLENTSGTWADSDAVLTPNASGAQAAAHIFVTSLPADASNGALATGFAAGNSSGGPISGQEVVPEPTSIALLGSIFIGVATVLRKKKQQGAS